jgi:hypothetical protein
VPFGSDTHEPNFILEMAPLAEKWAREQRGQNTHTFVHLSADLLQRTLNAVNYLPYRGRVLPSMFTLEYYARVSDYADGLAPRKQEITENRSVRGEESEGLFEFWGWEGRGCRGTLRQWEGCCCTS